MVLPKAPPIERRNSIAPVAVPTSRRSAAFCTMTMTFGMVMPMPKPSSAMATITRASGVLGRTAARPAKPTHRARSR